jgi:predicted RND superfamily exporter protein
MKKFARFIVNNRVIIILTFVLLSFLSIIATNYVEINSDIISYIPSGTNTADGYAFLRENFGMEGDMEVAVENVTFEEAQAYAAWLSGLDGVTRVIWSDSMNEMGGGALGLMGEEDLQAMQEKMDYLFHPSEEYYVFMMQLSYVPSSDEAMELIDNIDAKLTEDGVNHAFGGSTYITKSILDSTMGEIGLYTVVAMLVVIVILIIATSSYYEPILLFIALGVSILVNIGTNVFLNGVKGGVSIITFSASSVLQLALSIDYAIFLMHAFKEERQKTLNVELAMKRAIPKTFSTVAASALTTVGSFMALFVMKFGMGFDLGVVLAKGVFLSLVSVLIFQPCVIIATHKVFVKFEHKPFAPKMSGIAGFAVRKRYLIAIVALLLVIPALYGQSKIEFSYMQMDINPSAPTGVEAAAQKMGNSLVLVVPVDDYERHEAFIEELYKINDDGLTGKVDVFGIYTIMPDDMDGFILLMKDRPEMSSFISNGYTMYSIIVDVETESTEAFLARERVETLAKEYFPDAPDGLDTEGNPLKAYYLTGMIQGVYDLSVITPTDFKNVSILSLIIIAVILLLTFRSVRETIITVLVIQFGIWINLAIAYFSGAEVNFMAYIIISAIELGATVDYAILLSVKFKKYCTEMSVVRAAYYATADSAPAILTSASIMAGACFSVYFVASNMIVAEIVLLIARGAIISGALVLVLLPALLIIVTRELAGKPQLGFMHTYVDVKEYFNRGTKYNEPFVYPTRADEEKEERSFKLYIMNRVTRKMERVSVEKRSFKLYAKKKAAERAEKKKLRLERKLEKIEKEDKE